MRNKPNNIYVLLVLGTMFWGVNFHLAQIGTAYVSPMAASAFRYTFASIGLLVITPIFLKGYLNRELFRRTGKSAAAIALVGLSGVFLFNYFFFKGLSLTDAINGALLVSLNPMLTLLFASIFISAPIYKGQVFGIIISLLGVLIVITKGEYNVLINLSFNEGDLFLLLASILFAFHNVMIQKYLSWIHPVWLTILTTVGGGVLMIIFSMDSLVSAEVWSVLDSRFFLAMMGMGFLGTTLSFMFWNMGINRVGANRTAVFLNLIPVFAAVSGLLFQQYLSLPQILGGLFIAWGIVVTVKRRNT